MIKWIRSSFRTPCPDHIEKLNLYAYSNKVGYKFKVGRWWYVKLFEQTTSAGLRWWYIYRSRVKIGPYNLVAYFEEKMEGES